MRLLPLVIFLLAVSAFGQEAERFGDVGVCALCHVAIPAPAGSGLGEESIAPSAQWPGTMMAHAARDPYWRAKVASETALLPQLGEVIEDTCLACHAPMQQYDLRVVGKRLGLDDLDAVGKQGVACTVCHQITPEGLGTKASFEAHFTINDKRENYGPHAKPFTHPMQMHSGYTPAEGKHVLESSLCATCHTVITPTVDAAGKVVGEFVEQAPYLEWLASDFGDMGMSCQDCHMPVLEDNSGRALKQHIAHTPMRLPFPPTDPRQPFGRHVLAGGNVMVLSMMRDLFPDEAEDLDQKQDQTRALLGTALSIGIKTERAGDKHEIAVAVSNNTGHKLPTGYPSRRIWLHFTAKDAAGGTVFESGAWERATGEIAGLRGVEPHHARIETANQVMIYETETADTDGNVTFSLLRAAGYAKDNRLLPSGFDLARDLPEGIDASSIAPVGVADDPGFEPGGHTVVFLVPASTATVVVEALYQTIKPTHAAAAGGASPHQQKFADLFERHSAPVVLARQELAIAR
jgi:cytochrome c554/c'-like protein